MVDWLNSGGGGRYDAAVKWMAFIALLVVLVGAVVMLYVVLTSVEQELSNLRIAAPPAKAVVRPAGVTRPVLPARAIAERLAAPSTATAAAAAPRVSGPDAIPHEKVLSFYDDADLARFVALARARGLTVVDQIDRFRAVRVRGDDAALRAVLREGPSPTAQGANRFVRLPPDPKPPEGVVYASVGDAAAATLGVPAERAAWGAGVKVAILDTGIGPHPALEGVAVESVDQVGGELDHPHGTAVASIIAGRGEVQGIAPAVELMDVRIMDGQGRGDAFSLAQAVLNAVDGGAHVLNLSLGSYGDSFVLRDAVAYAQAQGVVVVAAAGNDGTGQAFYPAAYPGVVGVGAVDGTGRRVYFSNTGPGVDLVAPGVGITAAGLDRSQMSFSGTSASAPLVSGTIAALLSLESGLSGPEAVALLQDYANDTGAQGRDAQYGNGVVNVARILERDTPGIHDMALLSPHVQRSEHATDAVEVWVMAQNRGTEPAADITLRLDLDGTVQELKFYDVEVGATVGYHVTVPTAALEQGAMTVLQELEMPGTEDHRPRDNRYAGSISLQP